MEHVRHSSHILPLVGAILLVLVNICLVMVLMSSFNTAHAEGSHHGNASFVVDMSDSPNVVTNGMAMAVAGLRHIADGVQATFNVSTLSVTKSISSTTQAVTDTSTTLAQGAADAVGNGALVALSTLTHGVVSVLRAPGYVGAHIADSALVSAVIKAPDHSPVPIIDPNSPDLFAARAALPAAATASNEAAMWPLHGVITTEFGASDWPYQAVHTGIDISDGWAGGTAIHPFRSGRVIEVVHSRSGLGNHVVIDHGNGVTSVYGHLAETAVTVGQQVTQATVIGYEGSTGASTGPHLHFEIRVNGQAANPHQFIAGMP